MSAANVACPHCGAEFNASAARNHIPACVHRPGMVERVRAAMEDPDNPGVAISARVYRVRVGDRDLPTLRSMLRAWGGSWQAVCAHVGLAPGRRSGYEPGTYQSDEQRGIEALAEVEAALEADAALREHWRTRGLDVCGARRLPDGRTAWMVR